MSLTPTIKKKLDALIAEIDREDIDSNDDVLWSSLLERAAKLAHRLSSSERASLYEALSQVLEAAPWVPSARVVPRAWLEAGLSQVHRPLLALCHAVDVWGDGEPAPWLAEALSGDMLPALTEVSIRCVMLDEALWDALCGRAGGALTSLAITHDKIDIAALQRLCASPLCGPALCFLDLSDCGINAAGAQVLADAPSLSGLVMLELGNNPIGQAGRVALGRSPHLSAKAKSSARAIATAAAVEATGGREVFGDVRSALQQPAGPHIWAQICDLVSRQDAEQATNETVPYVDQALSRWPASERPLMQLWQDMLLNGEQVPPAAYLARSVRVSNYKMNAQRAGRVGKFMADAGVEALTLADGELSGKVMAAYLADHAPAALRSLDFGYVPTDDALALICERGAYTLERLALGRPDMMGPNTTEIVATSLCAGRCVQELRSFKVRATTLVRGGWREIAQAPWWSGLESLEVSLDGYARGEVARGAEALAPVFAGDAPWPRLARLALEMPRLPNMLAGQDAARLAARLPALRELALACDDGGKQPGQLVEALMSQLQELELLELAPADDALMRRLEACAPAQLRALRVAFGEEARRAARGSAKLATKLLHADCWRGLERLSVGPFYIESPELAAQALSALPTGLRALSLTHAELEEPGARALSAQALGSLRELALEHCGLSAQALTILSEAPWWQGLESLTIYTEGDAARALAGRLPAGLKRLELSALSDAGTQPLLKAGLPAGLEVLLIQSGALASKSYALLVPMLERLEQLHTLDLDNNAITAKMLEVLLASPRVSQLPIISMRGNKLGFAGKQRVLDAAHTTVGFKSGL